MTDEELDCFPGSVREMGEEGGGECRRCHPTLRLQHHHTQVCSHLDDDVTEGREGVVFIVQWDVINHRIVQEPSVGHQLQRDTQAGEVLCCSEP